MKYVTICIIWIAVAIVAWVDPVVSIAIAFCGMIATDEIVKS